MKPQTIHFRTADHRKRPVVILHQDDDLLVVDKPAGLPVIPDRWQQAENNLRDVLQSHLAASLSAEASRVWVVHRLDSDTSGVMLFARNADMHRSLNQLFSGNQVKKSYHAILEGVPDPPNGRIDRPLGPHPFQKHRMAVRPKGKASLTDYQLLEAFRSFSVVAAYPQSGRTHQIRVHFADIGCPLAVDPLYGHHNTLSLSVIKPRYSAAARGERPLMDRLSLHAYQLTFNHPASGLPLTYTSEPPKDFRGLLNALRKWNGK